MILIIASAAVVVITFCAAVYKGRTGWHWAVLALSAFGALWMASAAMLFVAGVAHSFSISDERLAAFAGGLSVVTVLAILAAVPVRPRRRSIPLDAAGRQRVR